MANEEKSPTAAAPAAGAGTPKSAPIALILNTLALIGVISLTFYSKFVFKRSVITEEGERLRLELLEKVTAKNPTSAFLQIPPMTVNIASMPTHPKAADGTSRQIEGKLHFLTIGFAMEIRDPEELPLLEKARPLILDKLIQIVGRKHFNDLTHVQGRYILRSQIAEIANKSLEMVSGSSVAEKLITGVYFTDFVVQ